MNRMLDRIDSIKGHYSTDVRTFTLKADADEKRAAVVKSENFMTIRMEQNDMKSGRLYAVETYDLICKLLYLLRGKR